MFRCHNIDSQSVDFKLWYLVKGIYTSFTHFHFFIVSFPIAISMVGRVYHGTAFATLLVGLAQLMDKPTGFVFSREGCY